MRTNQTVGMNVFVCVCFFSLLKVTVCSSRFGWVDLAADVGRASGK
jgi:hypothetical protein